MADLDKTPVAGNASADAENTQTRKTVKLKAPAAPIPSGLNPGAAKPSPIADPLSGRDTDTGNLDVLSDTQTRKTIKLKPVMPVSEKHPINIDAARKSATPEAAASATGTQTRKVVMLKPTPARHTPVDPTLAAKQTVVLNPSAESSDDETVKVQKVAPIKPAASIQTAISADNDETVKVQKVGAPAKPGASIEAAMDEDNTVKMQRPAPVAPQAATDKPTVRMAARPVAPKPAPVPAAPAAPAAPAVEKKTEEENADGGLALKKDDKEKSMPQSALDQMEELGLAEGVKIKKKSDQAPSAVYTVLAVLTLLFLIAAAVITSVQYLNVHESERIGTEIRLPVLSDAVK